MEEIKSVKHTLPEGGWIGVVSDTPVPQRARFIPPKLFKLLEGASLILHAGDLAEETVLEELSAIAPVEAVAGNMDSRALHKKLGLKKIVTINEMSIGLLHGRGRTREAAFQAYESFKGTGVKINGVIFGHTHFPIMGYYENILLFNPGSPVEPRGRSYASCGRIWPDQGYLKGEIFSL